MCELVYVRVGKAREKEEKEFGAEWTSSAYLCSL